MNTNSFFSLVPKGIKVAAGIVFAGALVVGPLFGAWQGHVDGLHTAHRMASLAVFPAIGLGGGLVVGTCVALWLLGLGYIYTDARRRAMPAVVWVLIAMFVPNLLGFLLYFALRRPLGLPCSGCGQLIAADQRFCSWCGVQGSGSTSASGTFIPPGSGMGPTAAV